MKLGLEGSHCLITGGSRGLGKAMAEEFLKEGANVSYCARTVTGDEFKDFTLAGSEAPGAPKPKVVGTSVDVSSEEQLKAWVKKAVDEFGRIDTVIVNASQFCSDGHDLSHWEKSFQTDLMQAVHLSALTVPYLKTSPHASMIIISSFSGRDHKGFPGATTAAPYALFKGAQLTYVNEQAHYLGQFGIRVNAIVPGMISCEGGPWAKMEKEIPEFTDMHKQTIALGKKFGEAQDVARAALYLGSPVAKYTTGTNLMVTGGCHSGVQN